MEKVRETLVAGFTAVRKDVLLYSMLGGEPPKHHQINTIGVRRAGVRGDRYKVLEKAYQEVRKGDKSLDDIGDTEKTCHLRDWLSGPSKRDLGCFLN